MSSSIYTFDDLLTFPVVPLAGFDWNVSTTDGWIAIKLGTDVPSFCVLWWFPSSSQNVFKTLAYLDSHSCRLFIFWMHIWRRSDSSVSLHLHMCPDRTNCNLLPTFMDLVYVVPWEDMIQISSRALTSLAKEKGMTSVATSMSAQARDTRKRFWGALRARLVNTATTTRTLPTTVPKMMTVTTSTMHTDATCEWGSRVGDLGEEEDVWLIFSKEEFGGIVAGIVATTDVNTSDKSILVKWVLLLLRSPFLFVFVSPVRRCRQSLYTTQWENKV